ncbi:hypothetical protein QJQ45_004446 [Haematococcus lacustris]|nr:hypothetical protein QJQ45_004446 [Haematococcus lacustris]
MSVHTGQDMVVHIGTKGDMWVAAPAHAAAGGLDVWAEAVVEASTKQLREDMARSTKQLKEDIARIQNELADVRRQMEDGPQGPQTLQDLKARLRGVMARVDAHVVQDLIRFCAPQLPYADDQLLLQLYQYVAATPHTSTKVRFQRSEGLVFNGPYSSGMPARAMLLTAFQNHTQPLLAKFTLDPTDIEHEHRVLSELADVPGIVGPYNERQMQAELLVDTGCDMDINISAYKADQLGLPKSEKATKVEMGQAAFGEVRRRGVVKAAVLMEDDGPGVLENDLSFAYLEVWSDEHDMPGPHTTDLGTGVLIIKVSPVKEGRDSKGFDAILGGPGMQRLGLGINKETHKLYVKRRTCLHLR